MIKKHCSRLLIYWIEEPFYLPETDKEIFNVINPEHEADWHIMQKAVYLRKTGITIRHACG